MSRRRPATTALGSPSRASRPLGSYVVRVLEERTVTVRCVYELRDIASGEVQRFASAAALQRWLAARRNDGRDG